MDEKERYKAQIEAKLVKFGETLHVIKTKKAMRNETQPEVSVDTIQRKHDHVKERVQALDHSDEAAWKKVKNEVDGLMSDIDSDLRAALSNFGG